MNSIPSGTSIEKLAKFVATGVASAKEPTVTTTVSPAAAMAAEEEAEAAEAIRKRGETTRARHAAAIAADTLSVVPRADVSA
jgi:hypothetical protein